VDVVVLVVTLSCCLFCRGIFVIFLSFLKLYCCYFVVVSIVVAVVEVAAVVGVVVGVVIVVVVVVVKHFFIGLSSPTRNSVSSDWPR